MPTGSELLHVLYLIVVVVMIALTMTMMMVVEFLEVVVAVTVMAEVMSRLLTMAAATAE